MGNHQGKSNVKKVITSEIKTEDDSSESYEEGTNVDIEPLKLKALEKNDQTLPDTNEDESGRDAFMSGLPGETHYEEPISFLTQDNDNNFDATSTHLSNPDEYDTQDKHNRKVDVENVSKSFGSSTASSNQSCESKLEVVNNATSQLDLRNDTAVMCHVCNDQEAENVNMSVSRIESVHEEPTECQPEVSKVASQSLRDKQTENEEKIKFDANSNIMYLRGTICYDATGQFRKRVTIDEEDNRCSYVETDSCDICDSRRHQIYSNVIFLPDKSKGASPKRYGPKRLGSKYDRLKIENLDPESDCDDEMEDSNSKNDESSKKETKQEVSEIALKSVHYDRNEDVRVVNDRESEHVNIGTDEITVDTFNLQFVEDHFGLYTGCEASGISQGNMNEPVVTVPNEQTMVTSRQLSANNEQEMVVGNRNQSFESNSSQLPVVMTESYPEMRKNDDPHGKEDNDMEAKDLTHVPKIQNVKGMTSDTEPVEACAICNKLCDECLCLFPKPIFKTVMTLSCNEHSKPILSYFRYLKIGGNSVDWSTLKSAQAKFAMCLKSVKTSLPDDNRIMLEFNLPSNKIGKTEAKDNEDKLKVDKTVVFHEDEDLIKFLEARVNLKEMSMTDSFNSKKNVIVNDFDDTSEEDMVLNEDYGDFDNFLLSDVNLLRSDNSGSTISSFEDNGNSADLNVVFNGTKQIDGLLKNEAIEIAATHSSEDSLVDEQIYGLSDSAQSCLEDSQYVTKKTDDCFKCTVNAIEDDSVFLESTEGLSTENTESVNAEISDERQTIHVDLQKERSGVVNGDMTNNTTSSTLRRSKTMLEDDNRNKEISDDEENVKDISTSEVLVTDNHSSVQLPVEPDTEETGFHFPFLSHDSSKPFTESLDLSSHLEQMRYQLHRRLEMSPGVESGTSLEDFLMRSGRQQRASFRPLAAKSEFAASFYETESQSAHRSHHGLVNKNARHNQASDILHEVSTSYLDSDSSSMSSSKSSPLWSRSSSPELLPTLARPSVPRSHLLSSASSSSSDDDNNDALVKNIKEELKKVTDFPKLRITVLCVDISDSMKGTPWQQVKEFISKFLSGLEKIRHEHGIRECVAMVTFGHENKIACSLTENFQLILNTLGDNKSVCKLQLHDIGVNDRIIMITDGYPSPSKCLTDSDEISDQNHLKAIQEINNFFDDEDMMAYNIYCVSAGDNVNACFLETLCQLTNGKLFGYTDVEELVRSTHNHYLCAQITNHMFKMPNTDELDMDMFKSLTKEIYPEASLADLTEMEKLAEDAYARLAAEKSEQAENLCTLQDNVNDHYEPQNMNNLPCLGTRVTQGPDLSEDGTILSEMGTVTGHSRVAEGKVYVHWDSGQEMMCCYGYLDDWEVLPSESKEVFRVDDEIKHGNKVRRGPDWCYGNDDGGSDQVGAVYDVCPEGVVWVRWPNGNQGNYRFNQDGMFDVLKSDPMDPTGQESFVAAMNQRNKNTTTE